MRHARQIPAQRRGGESTGSAWPSIVATTCSLSGAAAGITSLFLWTDTFHLRLGLGMAAAGAVYSSLAMVGRWRDKTTRRQVIAEVRQDAVAEMRFEIARREGQIAGIRLRMREAEETVVLFEQRAVAERARADASEFARIKAEHDLAVLSAWVHRASAVAELTRAAVQSSQIVQAFEPAEPEYASTSASLQARVQGQARVNAQARVHAQAQARVQPQPQPQLQPQPQNQPPRVLRTAVLTERLKSGFDVASDIDSAPHDPYLVPGVIMPRSRRGDLSASSTAAASPSRPISPERLYRPYLTTEKAEYTGYTDEKADAFFGTVDLTAHDDTTQLTVVEDRRSGTA